MRSESLDLSMREKLVVSMGLLLAAVAICLVTYLPARMDGTTEQWGERHATGMASVLAGAIARELRSDDPRALSDLLASLSDCPDVRYAAVLRADGSVAAGYKDELAGNLHPAADAVRVSTVDGQLRVDMPIRDNRRTLGVLTLGVSTDGIRSEARGYRTAVWMAGALIFLFGVVASLGIGNVVTRPILRSLRELTAAAGRVAKGDLVGRLEMRGPVALAFNEMIDGQRAIVEQIGDTSVHLAAATAEIYAAAQEQQATAQQQSAGVEEASHTMQSLLQSAAHIADSARGVLANAERTRETTDGMSKRFSELTGHTNRIAELLEVIREIADRSDLLALNASLEATRAGEAGRSFSLVAAEMRRLAERVTASVQDVKVLVADVRAFASSTIMAVEEARRLAEGTTESARQITLVTQQQRSGTEQVSQGMRDITSALTQSVSAAGQIRTSTEELKMQADRLAEIVAKFRVSAGEAWRES